MRNKTELAKDRFESVAQADANKATVLDLLKRNAHIRRQLPSSFEFNARKADHWIMVCDAIEFCSKQYRESVNGK
jgi:hypothetical protein